MKTTVFTIATMGIGLMSGITITHYHQVTEMVARDGIIEPTLPAAPVIEVVEQVGEQPKNLSSTRLAVSDVAAEPRTAAYYPPRTEREDALLELLAEMRKEQKKMHRQMAEQNRELAELTFRVDTHSDSFKPLRTDSKRAHSLGGISNGPQVPITDSDDSLLPPKPRTPTP